jgi:hypothetical protein
MAKGRKYAGATTVRRQERDRYVPGSTVNVRYLASEPASSWMEGYLPRRTPVWPSFVLAPASVFGAWLLIHLIRRQSSAG